MRTSVAPREFGNFYTKLVEVFDWSGLGGNRSLLYHPSPHTTNEQQRYSISEKIDMWLWKEYPYMNRERLVEGFSGEFSILRTITTLNVGAFSPGFPSHHPPSARIHIWESIREPYRCAMLSFRSIHDSLSSLSCDLSNKYWNPSKHGRCGVVYPNASKSMQ